MKGARVTLTPGLQAMVDKVQALIDAAPKHPLYDVFVNVEAMEHECRHEIIIGWRGKVQWTPEEHHRRSKEMMEILKYADARLPYGVEQPVWGNDIATSVFAFDAAPEDMFHHLMRMIDFNFLRSLENTHLAAHNWRWTKEAGFV